MSQSTIPDNQSPGPFSGTEDGLAGNNFGESHINAEATASIAFGTMVQKGTGDADALLLAGAAALDLIGIVAHGHYAAEDLSADGDDSDGPLPGTMLRVVRKGRVWVRTEEAVTPASTVRCRHTAGAGGTVLGAFRASNVANETFDCSSFAQWRTSAGAGGIALLEFDMTAAAATADVV